MSVERSPEQHNSERDSDPDVMLHSRSYLVLILISALIGIPLSILSFGFLVAVHQLEHVVWHTLPEAVGLSHVPPWWPICTLGIAGILVALAVVHLPGHGGHRPTDGLGGGATEPSHVPGTLLAAAAGLVLGAVIGPEAPLIAMGSGLALLAARHSRAAGDQTSSAIVAAAGSAAAISAVFGNPLAAAVILLELGGLARRRATLVILPCLVSSGVGALVFTGLGDWTGLEIGALSIPNLGPSRLASTEVLWAVPIAVVVGAAMWAVFYLGRRTAVFAISWTMATTVGAGVVAGCCAALYALLTDRSPAEVAGSGQATLATLAGHPEDWTAGALVALLACKGIAYGLCLGVFRGGPVFPALFLGAAIGVLASVWLPGVGTVAGLAIGMAAGSAVARLPVTGVVVVVLLLGPASASQMPVVILAVVAALVVEELLSSRVRSARP